MEAKFKAGDHLVSILKGRGLEETTVIDVDSQFYYLKIVRGIAILPISSQEMYKLKNQE